MFDLNIHLQPSTHSCKKKKRKKSNIQFPVLYQHICLWASLVALLQSFLVMLLKNKKKKHNGSFPVCYYDVKWAE